METAITHATTVEELERQVGVLACVEKTDVPSVSAYLDLEDGQIGWLDA